MATDYDLPEGWSTDHDWLDRAHALRYSINDSASHLFELAEAFGRVGSAMISDELRLVAEGLRKSAKELDSITSAVVNDRLKDSRAETTHLLCAVLSGAIKTPSPG